EYGESAGSFAELLHAPERVLGLKPSNLTFEQAAAMPVAAITALQGIRDHARAAPGRHILVNGASGGVGHFAVQIVKQCRPLSAAIRAPMRAPSGF
ncbi:MAG: hypothetical protein ACRDGH_13470, partial [Candidatus Limnocylindria bacterium]